ncbi:hypothetical protein ABZ819_05565 [Streptomyces venezuelae]|uniref:hypothetical protein n=1 Tax=Streptomyces venezuelae TaxID=54571 RepID=UPI0034377FEA
MDFLQVFFIVLVMGYGGAAAVAAHDPEAPVWLGRRAPLWLSWPAPIWDWIARRGRRPAPVPARPDYAKITRLERELGMTEERP